MIIGLSGKKGVGKNTAGDYLVEQHGFVQLSFAAALKQSAGALFGIDSAEWDRLKNSNSRVEIWEDGINLRSISGRVFLQRYGTEAHRAVFGDDFWVDQLLSRLDPEWDYVITDARFENECAAIRTRGGITIYIERDTGAPADDHPSEQPPSEDVIDAILGNNGSYLDLYRQLDEVVESYDVIRAAQG